LSCGGTWVDDGGNFKRVFGFSKPPEVKVLHSYYWKSPHWSVEYRYFISLQASPKFVDGLTSSELMTVVVPDSAVLDICGDERPKWFLPKPLANYVSFKRAGDLVFLSGQGPRYPDGSFATGKVGKDVTVEQAYEHAKLVGLGLLSAAINGCSDLFVAVLGENGRHARSAVGMGSLPNNITVEIEVVLRVLP